jgi:hypothetical protein
MPNPWSVEEEENQLQNKNVSLKHAVLSAQ